MCALERERAWNDTDSCSEPSKVILSDCPALFIYEKILFTKRKMFHVKHYFETNIKNINIDKYYI